MQEVVSEKSIPIGKELQEFLKQNGLHNEIKKMVSRYNVPLGSYCILDKFTLENNQYIRIEYTRKGSRTLDVTFFLKVTNV
jgi:hypothetical protein